MLKKLCLSAVFATISLIASAEEITQNKLTHITQEQEAINLCLQETITTSKKAAEYISNNDTLLESKIKDLIDTIFACDELINSLERITNMQVDCIVNRLMRFDDITYEPSDYPIDDKINEELAKAFPVLDEQTNQLFTIRYVLEANSRGSKILLEKLEIKKNELATLQA